MLLARVGETWCCRARPRLFGLVSRCILTLIRARCPARELMDRLQRMDGKERATFAVFTKPSSCPRISLSASHLPVCRAELKVPATAAATNHILTQGCCQAAEACRAPSLAAGALNWPSGATVASAAPREPDGVVALWQIAPACCQGAPESGVDARHSRGCW